MSQASRELLLQPDGELRPASQNELRRIEGITAEPIPFAIVEEFYKRPGGTIFGQVFGADPFDFWLGRFYVGIWGLLSVAFAAIGAIFWPLVYFVIGSVVLNVDPFAMRPTANLARLLIVWPDQRLFPALAANPKTGKVFAHPKVAELGFDPAVRKAIEGKDFAGLMQLPQVEKAAAYPDLLPLLSDVGMEDAMDQIVYGRTPNAK